MAFDTLSYAKKLQESGVPPRQAEAHAEALKELAEDNLATKRDLKDLEMVLRHEIDLVRRDLKDLETRVDGRFKDLETRMDGRFKEVDGRFRLISWMVGFNLALTVGVLLKLLIE